MVAAAYRISRGSDFNRTLKSGVRVSTRDLVVSVYPLPVPDPEDAVRLRDSDVVTSGGPRLGLIVSKAVGNAVTRHRLARVLRAAFRSATTHLGSDTLVVIRARPSAADSATLAAQVVEAFTHRRVVGAGGKVAHE